VLRDLGIWDEVASALATVYTAALTAKAEAPAEAARLIAMLTDDAGRETRRRLGFV
jgi:hypothetical protein